MTKHQLYQAIFSRKSTRKYDLTPLSADTLGKLQKFASTVKALDENIPYEFAYLGATQVKNLLPIKAPHYVCLYSEKKENYLMNAGFLLQQMDLYLSANDLGSCWLGMAKPSKYVPEVKNGLEFVIMIAFGNADGAPHRLDSEFRRKSVSDISNIPGVEGLLTAVRLAPSSSNTQPWFFSGSADEITVSREKLNLIKVPLYGKMNQIDIGIALCHLWLSFEHRGKSMILDFEKSFVPSGYEFMARVKVLKSNGLS